MNKKARDNRANQMNPNNPAYYKSRMGNAVRRKTKVIVVHKHHHHHHHVEKPRTSNNRLLLGLLAVSGGSYSR